MPELTEKLVHLFCRQWSSSGLNTTVDSSSNMIRCVSNHLTSFAVLVDVNGIEGDVSNSAGLP
jgi:hypothetical protein